jgi:hypothetical protein
LKTCGKLPLLRSSARLRAPACLGQKNKSFALLLGVRCHRRRRGPSDMGDAGHCRRKKHKVQPRNQEQHFPKRPAGRCFLFEMIAYMAKLACFSSRVHAQAHFFSWGR